MNKLMTHIVAGYPSLNESFKIALTMAQNGAAYIEIQIPFSDPVADGPTIMAANQAALERGLKVQDCFDLMEKLAETFKVRKLKTKLLFMSYYNILHSYGVEKFCHEVAGLGCYGLIVPDIPFDEEAYEGYLKACGQSGVQAVQIVSPLTSVGRLKDLNRIAGDFVYCVSRFGTTGTGMKLSPNLQNYLQRVRKYLKRPLAVGFGISSPNQVKAVFKEAEIAVVGSRFIELYEQKGLRGVQDFLERCDLAF